MVHDVFLYCKDEHDNEKDQNKDYFEEIMKRENEFSDDLWS